MKPEDVQNNIKDTLLNFIVPIVSLVVSLVLILAVFIPALQTGPDLRQELSDKRALEGQLRTKIGVLNKLVDFEAVVTENARLLTTALADEASVPELLTQIDLIARDSGLDVTKLSYSVTDVGGAAATQEETFPYKAVIINLGTLGNFDQMTTFLDNLANGARIVDVVSYRFSGEETEEGFRYAATFILRSPYLMVNSQAITDAPITVDISDPEFQALLQKVKALRHYDITVNTEFLEVEESDIEEVGQLEEDEIPEDEISQEEFEEIVEQSSATEEDDQPQAN